MLLLVGASIMLASCNTSKTYAERKRDKYRSSRTVVKSDRRAPAKTTRSHPTRTSKKTSVSSLRTSIVATAKQHLGTRYVYGGKKPGGFDCSGFTTHVYQANGIHLTGASQQQAKQGRRTNKSQLQAGDLIFFGKGKVSHVGIVASTDGGSLTVIHSTSSRGVVIEDIAGSSYWQSRYLYGKDILSESYASR